MACWRSEKKKKKDTARTTESDKSYRYRCSTRVDHWYFVKNGGSVQPSQAKEVYLVSLYIFSGSNFSHFLLYLLECKTHVKKSNYFFILNPFKCEIKDLVFRLGQNRIFILHKKKMTSSFINNKCQPIVK